MQRSALDLFSATKCLEFSAQKIRIKTEYNTLSHRIVHTARDYYLIFTMSARERFIIPCACVCASYVCVDRVDRF